MASAPDGAVRLAFHWVLKEREARFQGEGVARIAEPYRARLDLFGPRGEAVLSAALIEDRLRLPAGVQDAPLPPPALLWSVFGVFRPPEGAELIQTDSADGGLRLGYARGDEHWRFLVRDGRVRSAQWTDGKNGKRTVEIPRFGTLDRPAEVLYRDWTAFRELEINVDEAENVASFPAEIWSPGAP